MQQTALQKAIALAVLIPPQEIEKARSRFASLEKGIEFGANVSKTMFGVEQLAKAQLDARLSDLSSEKEMLRKLIASEEHQYRRLSLEPLKWRDEKGLPLLVVFTLQSSTFNIHCSGVPHETILSGIPAPIAECYRSIISWSYNHAHPYVVMSNNVVIVAAKSTIGISAQFSGVIPIAVKAKIQEAREIFGDQIFLIAEPKNLQVNVEVSVDPDPLVVGWDGKDLWLITAFDITPTEEAMINALPGV